MVINYLIFCLVVSVNAGIPKITSFKGPEYKFIPFQLETLTLRCTADGYPAPSIGFVFNSTKLQSSNRISINTGTLTIKLVDYVTDDGFYQCLAKNRDGAVLSNIIVVRIRVLGRFWSLHRIIDPSYAIDVTVGRPVEIRCPPHTYTHPRHTLWGDIRATGTPVVLHPNQKRFILSNGNLFYSYLEDSDINEINTKLGGVSCILYILGKYRPSVKMTLRKQGAIATDFRPVLREKLPAVASVKIGTSFTFFCPAAGKPLPTVLWYFNSIQIKTGSPGIVVSPTGHKLTLQSVGRASAGAYSCQVHNRLGTLTSVSRLNVEFPPSRNPALRDLKTSIGSNVNLNCTGKGTKPVTYEWYKNGEKLNSSHSLQMSFGMLHIKNARASSSGMYQCMARNIHGSLLSNVHLLVKDGYQTPSDDDKFSWRVIVGCVFGGFAFIIIITLGLYFIFR
eukprot:gene6113-6817_t